MRDSETLQNSELNSTLVPHIQIAIVLFSFQRDKLLWVLSSQKLFLLINVFQRHFFRVANRGKTDPWLTTERRALEESCRAI